LYQNEYLFLVQSTHQISEVVSDFTQEAFLQAEEHWQ